MKKTLFNLFVVLTLGIFILACSSPEEKKAEEISGFKINDLKKVVEIQRKIEKLKDDQPKSPDEFAKMLKEGQKIEEEAKKYTPELDGIKKILKNNPEIYKKIFGEDEMYKEALKNYNERKPAMDFVGIRDNNAEMQKLIEETRKILEGIDKKKFVGDNTDYVSSVEEAYDAKIEAINNLNNELLESFKQKNQDLSNRQKYYLVMFGNPITYYNLQLPLLLDKYGFPCVWNKTTKHC